MKLAIAVVTSFCTCLAGCIPDGELKIGFNMTPQALDDGWETSTPTKEGFSEEMLRQAYERFFSDEYVTAISLLVVRHGKLVAEGYCRSLNDRDVIRNIQSATKSVTSLVFGQARALGYVDHVDQELYAFVPLAFDDDPRKRAITLRHLLTMRSGIDFPNSDFSVELISEAPREQTRYIQVFHQLLLAAAGTEGQALVDCNAECHVAQV